MEESKKESKKEKRKERMKSENEGGNKKEKNLRSLGIVSMNLSSAYGSYNNNHHRHW